MFGVFVLTFVAVTVQAVKSTDIQEGIPDKKLISTFQIVRFPNDACTGSNAKNGTCYTSAECSDKGGASSGSCADGFGVCCLFTVNECGKSSSENITYFENPSATFSTTEPSSCQLTILPSSSNICQLRIDFGSFVITGPSTATNSQAHNQYGVVPTVGASGTTVGGIPLSTEINWSTNCLTDSFTISGLSSANSPPVICGTNTGQHMYVDADVLRGNRLQFQFSPKPAPTDLSQNNINSRGMATLASRKWSMSIYQYECGHINSAPPGCTQYLFGPVTGQVKTYNYDGAIHLANQNDKICIRRERGRCYACFAQNTANAIEFQTGGQNGVTNHYTFTGQPCGYNCELTNGISATGTTQCAGYDCVIIPGAFIIAVRSTGVFNVANTTPANVQTNGLVVATGRQPSPPQIAGLGTFGVGVAEGTAVNAIADGPAAAGGTAPASICTMHVPFQLTFKSDGFEGTGEDAEYLANNGGQRGVNLHYALIACA